MNARPALTWLILAAPATLAALAGCAANTAAWQEPPKPEHGISFAIHLAYDDAQPGCDKMTARLGETVYVARTAELDSRDLETARALHSETRNMLQLVLNYRGQRALESLTRNVCRTQATPPGPHEDPKPPPLPRLAVLIDQQLVCAPYIDRVVASGEIRIIDAYSWQEAEDTAAALNLGIAKP